MNEIDQSSQSELKLKNRLIGGVISVISVVTMLILFEFFLRAFFPQINLQLKDLYVRDEQLGFWYKPGYRGRIVTDEFDVRVKINSDGFRDYERELDPDAYRIVAIGDSFTFGCWVQFDDAYVTQLETNLNEAHPVGVNIVKSGGPAQGTAQQRIFLETRGLAYDPDVVLLGLFVGNDVRDTMTGLDPYRVIDGLISWKPDVLNYWREYNVLQDEWQDLPPIPETYPASREEDITWQEWIRANSHLYQFVAQNIQIVEENQTEKATPKHPARLTVFNYESFYLKEYPTVLEEGWEQTLAELGSIQALVEANGAELVIVLIPTREQVHAEDWQTKLDTMLLPEDLFDLDKPQEILNDWGEAQDVEIIDLLPHFREAAQTSEDRLYYQVDPHWNTAGHHLAADVIYDHFSSKLND